MASRYSLSAELPATRKSLRRSNYNNNEAASLQQQGSSIPEHAPPLPTPSPNGGEKLSVSNTGAWSQSQTKADPTGGATVRRDLSLRRAASRGTRKGAGGNETSALKSEFDTSDATYDERGYLVLKSGDRFGLTTNSFTENPVNDEGRSRSNRLAYLEGIRGVLGLQVLIWTFFRIFAPAVVADRDIDGVYPARFILVAPRWQNILRKVLSPLLFDGELQASFFVILCGRASVQTFIERRKAIALSGAAFKRPFRFLFPVAITMAIVSIVIAVGGFTYAPELSTALENQLAQPPRQWSSALEYFNSLLFFFSTPYYFKTARATLFIPPSGTLWIIPVVFQQTYVLIILAFALPYTIFRYKNLGMILLILTTAWVGRWSWYTLTGLLFAEWSTVYLQLVPAKGIPVNREGSRHVPIWVPGVVFAVLGAFFKYLWIAALPEDFNNEIVAHVDGNTGKLNYNTNPAMVAFPRYDNWLLATGVLYLIEISPALQRVLSTKALTHVARWAFSIALITGTLMLSLGSLIFHHLTQTAGWTNQAGILGVLFLCLIPTSCALAELYSRAIDDASLLAANWLFKWVRI